MAISISVCIIAKNEALQILSCLASVQEADEIIVVIDSASNDKTEELVRGKATVFKRKFDNFAAQKNFALSKTKNDWGLSLDADEVMQKGWFRQTGFIDEKYSGYSMPRQNIIFGRAMRFTDWGPWDDAHVWLFNKHKAKFVGDVHEEVIVSGAIGKLSLGKIHQNYKSVEQFIDKMNQYTTLESKSKKLGWGYPLWKFVRHFFVHLGFLDGWHGLFISYLMGVYGLTTCIKSRLS